MSLRRQKHRAGYSLLELVVALPAMTMLMAGAAAAISLASRATPDSSGTTGATLRAASALELFSAEMACATSITSRSASQVTFVTPDRTGDGAVDTVTYGWANAAGLPFTRQINGSASQTLLGGVQSLTFTYTTITDSGGGGQLARAIDVRLVAPAATSPEVVARVHLLNEPTAP